MSFFEQIQHYLYRVEGLYRYLNKESIPITHRTVPKTRELQSFQFPALITLGTDKTGIVIHIIKQVELFSLIISEATYEVNRIEVGCGIEGFERRRIILVNLNTFENLE